MVQAGILVVIKFNLLFSSSLFRPAMSLPVTESFPDDHGKVTQLLIDQAALIRLVKVASQPKLSR